MKKHFIRIVPCLIAIITGVLRVSAIGDTTSPVQYELQLRSTQVSSGSAPALRITATNISAASIVHSLSLREGYTIRINGPTGQLFFSTRAKLFPPDVLRLQPGETKYILGSASTYFQADPWYFSKTGTYHLRYCDTWNLRGQSEEVCAPAVKVHVGNDGGDHM